MSSLRDRKSSRIEEADGASGLSVLSAPRLPEVVIGTIVRLAESGAPEVDFPANPSGAPVAALTTAAIDAIAGRARGGALSSSRATRCGR